MSTKFKLTPQVKFNCHPDSIFAFEFFTFRDPLMVAEMKSFLSFTKDKNKLLDVGALFGIFSLAFTSFGKGHEAWAVEPSPTPFDILSKNIALNPKLKITPFKVALGATNGQMKMAYEWLHMVAVPKKVRGNYEMANSYKMDDFLTVQKLEPDVIKIDVEGSEYNVLLGGKKFLKKKKPLIFLETHLPWLKNLGTSISELINLVNSLGYRAYDLDGKPIQNPKLKISSMPNYRIILSPKSLI